MFDWPDRLIFTIFSIVGIAVKLDISLAPAHGDEDDNRLAFMLKQLKESSVDQMMRIYDNLITGIKHELHMLGAKRDPLEHGLVIERQ